jgi:hypothetical protein
LSGGRVLRETHDYRVFLNAGKALRGFCAVVLEVWRRRRAFVDNALINYNRPASTMKNIHRGDSQ